MMFGLPPFAMKSLPYAGAALAGVALIIWHNIEVSSARKAGDTAGYNRAVGEMVERNDEVRRQNREIREAAKAAQMAADARFEQQQAEYKRRNESLSTELAETRTALRRRNRDANTETLNTVIELGPSECRPDDRLLNPYLAALSRARNDYVDADGTGLP